MGDFGDSVIHETWEPICELNSTLPWDVYWDYSYVMPWAEEIGGKPKLFSFTCKDNKWIYAFLERSIAGTNQIDLETPYGYGGPLSNTTDPDFLNRAFQHFKEWAIAQGVVTEFIRFHPLIENWKFCVDPNLVIEENRPTVFVNFQKTEEILLNEMSPAFRRGARKARSLGLIFSELDSKQFLSEFVRLYKITMNRVGANQMYFFRTSYFESLFKQNISTHLLGVLDGQRLAAAAILLSSGNFLHYHLGCSDPELLPKRPNNLLFFEMLRWAKSQNSIVSLHLGGGDTSSPDNPLLHFKASIASNRARYFTGKRVWNRQVYDDLCFQAIQRDPSLESFKGKFLQLYRVQ